MQVEFMYVCYDFMSSASAARGPETLSSGRNHSIVNDHSQMVRFLLVLLLVLVFPLERLAEVVFMMDWRLFLTLLRKSRENQELRRSPARLRTSPAGFTGWEELVPTPPSCDLPFMVSKFRSRFLQLLRRFLGIHCWVRLFLQLGRSPFLRTQTRAAIEFVSGEEGLRPKFYFFEYSFLEYALADTLKYAKAPGPHCGAEGRWRRCRIAGLAFYERAVHQMLSLGPGTVMVH